MILSLIILIYNNRIPLLNTLLLDKFCMIKINISNFYILLYIKNILKDIFIPFKLSILHCRVSWWIVHISLVVFCAWKITAKKTVTTPCKYCNLQDHYNMTVYKLLSGKIMSFCVECLHRKYAVKEVKIFPLAR